MRAKCGGEEAIDLSSLKKHLGNRINTRNMTSSDKKNKKFASETFAIYLCDLSVSLREHVFGLSGSAQFQKLMSFRFRPEFPELAPPKRRLPLPGPDLAYRRWIDPLGSD